MTTKRENLIGDQEEYMSLFNDKKQSRALKMALDTRKFEIDLYWRRAAYFWVFIGVAFVAFFQVITSSNTTLPVFMTIIVSVIGFFFSLGWYFVNRGSKYWQENWEQHVYFLEKEIQGPLYSSVKIPDQRFWDLTDSYPFSVSKVNQLLNVLMILFWLVAFVFSLIKTFCLSFSIVNNELCLTLLVIAVALFVLFGLTFVFFKFSKSSIKRDYEKVNDNGLFLKL